MTATPAMTRFPQIGGQSLNVVSKHRLHRDTVRQSLPHIGTYVIDTPRDKFLDWRQQYFRYHETNRGVLRKKIESLPDVPKRWDLRTTRGAPGKQPGEAETTPTTSRPDRTPETTSSGGTVSEKLYEFDKFADPETILRMERQMTSHKLKTEQSHFPRNNLLDSTLHCNISWSSSPQHGLRASLQERTPPHTTRRLPSLSTDFHAANQTEISNSRRRHQNFSVDVGEHNLTGPESRPQIDPANLSHLSSRDSHPCHDMSHDAEDSSVGHVKHSSCEVNPESLAFTPKNVGPSSKHSLGPADMMLGDILKNTRRAPPGGNRNCTRRVLGMNTWPDESCFGDRNKDGAPSRDGGEGGLWLDVVNTPVVDGRVYDRYAHVKLMSIKK